MRDALCTVVDVGDAAVATSGTAERGAHVIDPHTGCAAVDLGSVTIIGADLGVVDTYATAALAMGFDAPAWLAALQGYEAFFVDAGGFLWETPGFAHYRAERDTSDTESTDGCASPRMRHADTTPCQGDVRIV